MRTQNRFFAYNKTLLTGCLCALLSLETVLVCSRATAQGQPGSIPLLDAASATELPLVPWGPYARTHLGPCYLVNRFQIQSFAFPIVIGQRRDEVMAAAKGASPGKAAIGVQRVVLQRRTMGLAPILAEEDDRVSSALANAGPNRMFQMVDADADGTLWRARAHFAPAALAQSVLPAVDETGKPKPTAEWGEGEAVVDYFPAFAEPHDSGLLIRVAITNRSSLRETYYVDLLGGMNTVSDAFALSDLAINTDPHSDGVVVSHKRCEDQFALAANSVTYPLRYYQVNDSYYAQDADTTVRNASGFVVPKGAGNAPVNIPRGDPSGAWGLLRVDDIVLEPGKSTTLFLSVGVGRDPDNARDAAQTLLSLADDAVRLNKNRSGLYTQALQVHQKNRFSSGNSAIDRLMAQSLANIPFTALRRVGVPSRQPTEDRPRRQYQATMGGMMALGWSFYRQDWAAAQLNAYYLTFTDSEVPVVHPQAVPPINLFALWDLVQKTHDRQVAIHFYAYALRRYNEFLKAGRVDPAKATYAWNDEVHETTFAPCANALQGLPKAARNQAHVYGPDYATYVILSAKIMQRMAEWLHLPEANAAQFATDARDAANAMNATLWQKLGAHYASLPDSKATPPWVESESLGSLMPLIAGEEVVDADRSTFLLKRLKDPDLYWGKAGLRSRAPLGPDDNAANSANGVHIGINYLFWKALLDYGEPDTAAQLADNLVKAYQAAQTASDTCPEWLDPGTGGACGAKDFSGDTCALIPLYAAYHTPGTVSTGWDTEILDHHYDADHDTFHIVFKSYSKKRQGVLLAAMQHVKGNYVLLGSIGKTVTADANGVLTIDIPQNQTTLSVDIAPATAGDKK